MTEDELRKKLDSIIHEIRRYYESDDGGYDDREYMHEETVKALLSLYRDNERAARIDENKMYHYALMNAGLHEPNTIGLQTFTNRIIALSNPQSKENADE